MEGEKKFSHWLYCVLMFYNYMLQTYSITAPISQMLKMKKWHLLYLIFLFYYSFHCVRVYNFYILLCSHHFHSYLILDLHFSRLKAHTSPPPKVYTFSSSLISLLFGCLNFTVNFVCERALKCLLFLDFSQIW